MPVAVSGDTETEENNSAGLFGKIQATTFGARSETWF
jgi:hypothetical protein